MDDIERLYYASEVAPDMMFKLLTEEWKLSEKLALAVISLHGGNVYHTELALSWITKEKYGGWFNYAAYDSVNRCLLEAQTQDDKGVLTKVIQMLTTLAEKGFVPIDLSDRFEVATKIITDSGVAGLVTQTWMTTGVPTSVWKECGDHGLVPQYQSTRLMIARQLVMMKEDEK